MALDDFDEQAEKIRVREEKIDSKIKTWLWTYRVPYNSVMVEGLKSLIRELLEEKE